MFSASSAIAKRRNYKIFIADKDSLDRSQYFLWFWYNYSDRFLTQLLEERNIERMRHRLALLFELYVFIRRRSGHLPWENWVNSSLLFLPALLLANL